MSARGLVEHWKSAVLEVLEVDYRYKHQNLHIILNDLVTWRGKNFPFSRYCLVQALCTC